MSGRNTSIPSKEVLPKRENEASNDAKGNLWSRNEGSECFRQFFPGSLTFPIAASLGGIWKAVQFFPNFPLAGQNIGQGKKNCCLCTREGRKGPCIQPMSFQVLPFVPEMNEPVAENGLGIASSGSGGTLFFLLFSSVGFENICSTFWKKRHEA